MTQRGTTRRGFLEGAAAAAAGAALSAWLEPRARAETPPRRPNIVYMMTDDQAWHALSIEGNPVVKTPNIDRIAREGVRFANMFVTNALCAPSRASFLTGKYSHVHGVRTNSSRWTEQPIFTDYLKAAGYQTCFLGKFHQGGNVIPNKPDIWMGFTDQGVYNDQPLMDFDGQVRKVPGHNTDALAQRAVTYLKEHRRDPFCLLLWFKAPHRSWVPAERHKDLWTDVQVPRPPTFDTDYAGKPEAVRKTDMQVETAKPPKTFDEWVKDYYRTIADVDDAVGLVMKTLEELGILDNTIVVFTSDNGFFLGEHHFFDKRLMYEPSIRVPMIVRYPGVVKDPGRVIPQMALNVDLAPTLLDLAGMPVPADMQGVSWRPLLEGRQVPWRKSWYYEYYEYPAVHMVRPCRGVRTERWKYIEWPEFHAEQKAGPNQPARRYDHPAEYELYDLQTDPHETKNLYGDPAFADKVEELRKEMARLRAELKDPDLEAEAAAAAK